MNNSFHLFEAIQNGDIQAIVNAFSAGWNPNIINPKTGWTPLTIACASQHADIVKYLLQNGAEVHGTNKEIVHTIYHTLVRPLN
jgi:ankyrin repeat protein